MIAAEPAAAVILESELPGGTQKTRASATGCPGVAASSPTVLFGARTAAGQRLRVQIRDRKMTDRRRALADAALDSSAVGLKRSFRRQSATRQAGNHERCGRVAGPAAFVLRKEDVHRKQREGFAKYAKKTLGHLA